MLLAGKIHRREPPRKLLRCFPANLLSQSRRVAGCNHGRKFSHKREEDGLDKIPIRRPASEQPAQPKLRPVLLVDINCHQVPCPARRHVEPQPVLAALPALEQRQEPSVDKFADALRAVVLPLPPELAELT